MVIPVGPGVGTMTMVTTREDDSQSILPQSNVPADQRQAHRSATTVDYLSELDILSRASRIRLSGVVCTIGPATREVNVLVDMIETGMNIARMNFSHGSHEYHAGTIANVREACKKYAAKHGFEPSVAIALDTKGPEIRTGLLEGDDGRKEIVLETGAKVRLTTDDAFKEKCTKDVIWVDYKNIVKVVKPGKRIYIDDGLISVVAKEIGEDSVVGEVENGGNLGSRKGCNLPGTDTDLPAVSGKDIEDLRFGVKENVDMIFASFIRDADGVHELRKVLGEEGKKIKIIPKIENQQGINNIDEIIEASDGIMVARGDMGIEIPPEKVFIAQKQIIAKCNKAGKPVICATQMLDSMIKKPRPTRAEGSDVANAILDGADCVMLSGETAKGDYPLHCVKTMCSLAREAEACIWNEKFFGDLLRAQKLVMHQQEKYMDSTNAIATSAVLAAYNINAAALITMTTSGKTAQLVSMYRPHCPILAITRFEQVARQLQLHRGVIPLTYHKDRNESEDWNKDVDDRINFSVDFGKQSGFIKAGDHVVCITGWRQDAGSSNTVRILEVK